MFNILFLFISHLIIYCIHWYYLHIIQSYLFISIMSYQMYVFLYILFILTWKWKLDFDLYSVLFVHWSTQSGLGLPNYLLVSGGSTVSHHHLQTMCWVLHLPWSSECCPDPACPVVECETWPITAVDWPVDFRTLVSLYQMSFHQQSLPNLVISLLSVWPCTITYVYIL